MLRPCISAPTLPTFYLVTGNRVGTHKQFILFLRPYHPVSSLFEPLHSAHSSHPFCRQPCYTLTQLSLKDIDDQTIVQCISEHKKSTQWNRTSCALHEQPHTTQEQVSRKGIRKCKSFFGGIYSYFRCEFLLVVFLCFTLVGTREIQVIIVFVCVCGCRLVAMVFFFDYGQEKDVIDGIERCKKEEQSP